jgi:cbb3-type cytochrome oxidase maturation protein
MYYPYFISYMLAGLVIALLVFAWAMKNHQFRDQQRARFLPLFDAPLQESARTTRISRIEVYTLFGWRVWDCAAALRWSFSRCCG